MVIGSLGEEPARLLEQLGQRLISLKDLHTRDVADLLEEPSRIVDRNNHRNPDFLAGYLVVLTIGRCLVDNSCSFAGGNIVSHHNAPGVFHAPCFDIRVVIKNAGVGDSV